MPGLIDPTALNAHIQAWQSPAPGIKPTNLSSVPALNQALRAGQINKNQWQSQFKVIQNRVQPTPKIDTSVRGNLNPFPKQTALHQALDKVIAKPVVSASKAVVRPAADIATGQGGKLVHDTAQLTRDVGSPATYFLNASIVNPAKELAAQLTHNQVAFHNANIKSNENLGLGDNGRGIKHGLLKLGANSAFLAAGAASPGIVAKGAKKGVEAVKTAVGKDTAVNRLVDAQRAAQAAQLADKAGGVGSRVVKEANTTHVPVINPTETTAARINLGNTALTNADRTRIPVAGKSTEVVGKPVTVSSTSYVKQSQQLSKAYDREVNALKDQPVIAQKVIQPLIDKKYQGLQQKLDESAGKTSFAFNSKPRAVKETSAVQPAPKVTTGATSVPTAKTTVTVATDGTKPSGSALRTEQTAVQNGMKNEITDKATYSTVSHKQEAANAVDLLHSDPQKAMKIAMGETAGNNASHEAAVYHAVANDALQQAKRTGDYSVVTQLASSSRHTGVSEAAQKLGAEGYNLSPHDPIKLMGEITKTREKAVAKRTGSTVAKETANIGKQVKSNSLKVSREDWHSFVESLKC